MVEPNSKVGGMASFILPRVRHKERGRGIERICDTQSRLVFSHFYYCFKILCPNHSGPLTSPLNTTGRRHKLENTVLNTCMAHGKHSKSAEFKVFRRHVAVG